MIDIYDDAYLLGRGWSKNVIYPKPIQENRFISAFNFISRLLATVVFIFRRLSVTRPISLPHDILFYGGSKNQLRAIKAVVSELGDNACCVLSDKSTADHPIPEAFELKFALHTLVIGLVELAFFCVFQRHRFATGVLEAYGEQVFKGFFYYHNWRYILKRNPIQIVVMSNDHNVENRTLLRAAAELGVKSVYLQHAHVTQSFPHLRFDLAFLDGVRSAEIYANIKESNLKRREDVFTRVVLSGSPIYSKVSSRVNKIKGTIRDNISCVGIALNEVDDYETVREVINEVLSSGRCVRIRCHPLQDAVFVAKIAELAHSNRKIVFLQKESLDEFLAHSSVLIAGDSNIQLDALFSKVPSYYLKMSLEQFVPDYYGFVKNGVVIQIMLCELKDILIKPEITWRQIEQLKLLNASFDSDLWGNEARQIATQIQELNNERRSSNAR